MSPVDVDPSGRSLAEAFYAAGNPPPVVEQVPRFTCIVTLTVEAVDETEVRKILTPLVSEVLSDDAVVESMFTIAAVPPMVVAS